MGTKIYGIGAAQNPDNADETILLDGLDDSRCHVLKDEHPEQENFFHQIGGVLKTRKIYKPEDCEDEKQARCWRHAQVPFLYVEAEIADDTDHPNAKSAAALLRFSKRPDVPLDVGFSIDGGIARREDANGNPTEDAEVGKILAHTIGTGISMTVKPCNPKCVTFLENDLTKSAAMALKPPPRYWEALKKSIAKTSFNVVLEDEDLTLYLKCEKLKKSLKDYMGGFTSMKCKNCGNGVRFFKSSKDLPNGCTNCGGSFSMADIWSSLNK